MFSVTFYIFAVCLNHIVIEAHKSIGQKNVFCPTCMQHSKTFVQQSAACL